MQPKNRPIEEEVKNTKLLISEPREDDKMRIKEYDHVKNKSIGGSLLNSGNFGNSELVSGGSYNQNVKKVVTSVKNSLNDHKSS